MARRKRLLSITALALVVLTVPTFVVFTIVHVLPDTADAGFRTHVVKKPTAGGSSTGDARRSGGVNRHLGGWRLPTRRAQPVVAHGPDRRSAEIDEAIVRGGPPTNGAGADASSGAGGAADASARHPSNNTRLQQRQLGEQQVQQQHQQRKSEDAPMQQQQQQPQKQQQQGATVPRATSTHDQQQEQRAAKEAQQQQERIHQHQLLQRQKQEQQQAQQHASQQQEQHQPGQHQEQQAPQQQQQQQQQDGQADPRHAARKELYGHEKANSGSSSSSSSNGGTPDKAKLSQDDPVTAAPASPLQQQQQNHTWPPVLPVGAGPALPRPNCADQETSQRCKDWTARGDCNSNPGYMYHHCASSCGLCNVTYLHGGEVPQQVEVVPGVQMPMVGYGTAGLGDLTADAVFTAIREGYRLVDSAQAREWYREDLVGAGWSASGIKREHLFITTKVHPRNLGYWSTLQVFSESLQDLQTDYVDLVLLHYPECWGDLCGGAKPEGTWQDSWAALEQLITEGKLRAAGVSNFNLDQMRELVGMAKVKPALLQSNSDLLRQDWQLQEFCRRHGILFQAYSSLGGQWLAQAQGRNPVVEHPTVLAISQRLGRTPAQVALRWALQHGQAVVPRTTKVDHMESNLDLFSFDLTDGDMQQLDALDGTRPTFGDQAQARERRRR